MHEIVRKLHLETVFSFGCVKGNRLLYSDFWIHGSMAVLYILVGGPAR